MVATKFATVRKCISCRQECRLCGQASVLYTRPAQQSGADHRTVASLVSCVTVTCYVDHCHARHIVTVRTMSLLFHVTNEHLIIVTILRSSFTTSYTNKREPHSIDIIVKEINCNMIFLEQAKEAISCRMGERFM